MGVMPRSFAFTAQGRLHSSDIEISLMPPWLAGTTLFLWVDLESKSLLRCGSFKQRGWF
jgi:hypothetical protein